MPTYYKRSASGFLSLAVIVCLLIASGCSKSGNDEAEKHEVIDLSRIPVLDRDGFLEELGVENEEQLVEKVKTEGVIQLVEQIHQNNPKSQSDDVARLLRENDKSIEYNRLVKQGISPDLTKRLSILRSSPVELENLVEFPVLEYMASSDISADARKIYADMQRAKINRQLRHVGETPLSDVEFSELQEVFEQVDMNANFGNLDRQLQNLSIKVLTPESQDGSTRALTSTPSVRMVNPVIEEHQPVLLENKKLSPDLCLISQGFTSFPQPISQPDTLIEHVLIDNDNGDVEIRFNHKGIAVIKVAANNSASLKNSAGHILISSDSVADEYIYLPITSTDTCEIFTFSGAANVSDITLESFITEERLPTKKYYVVDGQSISSEGALELLAPGGLFQPYSLTFSTLGSDVNELKVRLESDLYIGQTSAIDLLLYSPSGELYKALNQTVSEGLIAITGMTSVAQESGIWRLDLLPAGSVAVSGNQLTGLVSESAGTSDISLIVQPYINVGNTPKTAEFVLGIMETLSFNRTGEPRNDVDNEGDIHVKLHSAMAPPLEMPSVLDKVMDADTGSLSPRVAIWQCWEHSPKTGFEFESGEDCDQWSSIYLELEGQFEEQSIYANGEVYDRTYIPYMIECPQWYVESNDNVVPGEVCEKGFDKPYDWVERDKGRTPADRRARYVMRDHASKVRQGLTDEDFLYALSNHYELYNNWLDRAILVEASRFPAHDVNVKTRRYYPCLSSDFNDGTCTSSNSSYFTLFEAPAQLEPKRPVFGAPVINMNTSTDPISVDYAAWDADVYDSDGLLFAVLDFVASQALNVVNGNFIGMVCDSVGLADDMHQLEEAAKDDPVGNARFSINRFSVADSFYGLHNQKEFRFYMSGVAEINEDIDTYGQKISYAQIACGAANIFSAGSSFISNADQLLSIDYSQIATHDQIIAGVLAAAATSNATGIADQAEEIATLIERGDFDGAKALLKTGSATSLTGVDIYSSPEKLLEGYKSEGSSANGNNIVKSYADIFSGDDERTQAGVRFERVSSVPVSNIQVTLNRIKVISNYEGTSSGTDKPAELRLYPFVGEVNDVKVPGKAAKVFNTSNDFIELPREKVRINNVMDGDTVESQLVIYDQSFSRNAAALYLELSIMEDDGLSLEDDDMIGIFSTTIKLEELLNRQDGQWEHVSGNEYRLILSEVPVYSSHNLALLENKNTSGYRSQQAHNRNRTPSALVTMTVNVSLSSTFPIVSPVDTSLTPQGINVLGKDTGEMDAELLAAHELPLGDLVGDGEIHDAFSHQVLLIRSLTSSGINTAVQSDLSMGAVYSVNPNSGAIAETARYNFNDFTGDLLPIKEAVDSAAAPKVGASVRLLDDNRLLFVISHHDGARLMVAEADAQGDLFLVSSQLITDDEEKTVHSITDIDVSEDRSRLLVSYLPYNWLSGSAKKTPITQTNLYQLNLASEPAINYQGTLKNPLQTMLTTRFMGNDHVLVFSGTQQLLSSGSDNWDSFYANWQPTCSTLHFSCFFELLDPKLKSYALTQESESSVSFDLKDLFQLPYGIERFGKIVPKTASVAGMFHTQEGKNIERVGIQSSAALFKHWSQFVQLYYNDVISGFTFSGAESFHSLGRDFTVKMNPVWGYFCHKGIECSGYLDRFYPYQENREGVYGTPERLRDFEFVDYKRDMIATIASDTGGRPFSLRTYQLFTADVAPERFSFVSKDNVARTTLIESEEITITGINRYSSISIMGGEYWRSSTEEWSSDDAADLTLGETVKVRLTSSTEFETSKIATLTIGNVAADFTVSTIENPDPVDAVPDPFTFNAVENQSLGAYVESEMLTITGINVPVPLSIVGGVYALSGTQNWQEEDTVVTNGTTLRVRHTASYELNTSVTSTLTVGGISADFVSTTVTEPEKSAPYINGYVTCSIDSPVCNFAFTDDSDWRAAITQVQITDYSGDNAIVLTSPDDYQMSAGNFKLLINETNNMVKQSGNWRVQIKANGYYSSDMDLMIDSGYIRVRNILHSETPYMGKVINVSMELENRFGEPVPYASINPELIVENTISNINEVYRYSGGNSGFVPTPLSADDHTKNILYADGNGLVTYQIHIPGCVDLNDGFEIKYSNEVNSHSYFRNVSGQCFDTEWTRRFEIPAVGSDDINVATDSDGNVYYAIKWEGDFAGFTNQGSYDIYVIKMDRNGEQKWVIQVASSGWESIGHFSVYRDSTLILAGTTSGDIDGNVDGINLGGNDLFVQSIDSDGHIQWSRQWGTANNDTFIAASSNGTTLYTVGKMDITGSTGDQELHGINLENGIRTELLTADYMPAKTVTDIEVVTSMSQVTTYFMAAGSYVYRINAADGALEAKSPEFEAGSAILLSQNQSILYASMLASDAMGGEELDADGHDEVRIVALDDTTLSALWSRLISTKGTEYLGNAPIESSEGVAYVAIGATGLMYPDDALAIAPKYSLNFIALHGEDGHELNHASWYTTDHQYAGLRVNDLQLSSSGVLYLAGDVKDSFNSTGRLTFGYPFSYESFVLKTKVSALADPLQRTGLNRLDLVEVVQDFDNQLDWDDRSLSLTQETNWPGAVTDCADNTLNSLSGWRLPTAAEMNRVNHIPAAGTAFKYFDELSDLGGGFDINSSNPAYWTSLGWIDNQEAELMWIYAPELYSEITLSTDWHHYRCVRDQ